MIGYCNKFKKEVLSEADCYYCTYGHRNNCKDFGETKVDTMQDTRGGAGMKASKGIISYVYTEMTEVTFSDIKQVIIVRKDLGMRRGKESSHIAHASMKVFFDRMRKPIMAAMEAIVYSSEILLTQQMKDWVEDSFTKVVVSCNSEEELLDLQRQAEEAGIVNALILDRGLTEFNEPTYTCLAIGPDYSKKIDEITGGLKLR